MRRRGGEGASVVVLGSTGSIGRQTLEVIDALGDRVRVLGLAAAGTRAELFLQQIRRYRPRYIATPARDALSPHLRGLGCEILELDALAALPEAAVVVAALSGHAGLAPTLAALRAGKRIALANKETVVIAGALLKREMRASGACILPVDSEPSAVWQCLLGEPTAIELPDALVPLGHPAVLRPRIEDRGSRIEDRGSSSSSLDPRSSVLRRPSSVVRRLLLTASGGALRDRTLAELERVSPEQVLRHPTWSMGQKVTVDSATLMNKGLEVIEAHHLFGLQYEQIDVILHRESIVHSLVEFADGSLKAQLAVPDMRLPIQYALTYPDRLPGGWPALDLIGVGRLTFGGIDLDRYPCLRLAVEAGRRGGTYPAVLSGADEAAVELFLTGQIPFGGIPRLVEAVLTQHDAMADPALAGLLHAEAWAGRRCRELASAGQLVRTHLGG